MGNIIFVVYYGDLLMTHSEQPPTFLDQLHKNAIQIHGDPRHGRNAARYLQWIALPTSEIWYDRGAYYLSPCAGVEAGACKLDISGSASEEVAISAGMELLSADKPAPYERKALPPAIGEQSTRHHTIAFVKKGEYTADSVEKFGQSRNLDDHRLSGSLGGMLDIIGVSCGLIEEKNVPERPLKPGIFPRDLLEAIRDEGMPSSRHAMLSNIIQSALSRHLHIYGPDKKGEVVLQGDIEFRRDHPLVGWESMPYDTAHNLAGRYKPLSPMNLFMTKIAESQTLPDSV